MERQNGAVWLTAREFAEKTGLLVKSLQGSFKRHNLVRQRINKILHYRAAPSLTDENSGYIEGCITVSNLAAQLGISEVKVVQRLLDIEEQPIMYGKTEGYVYKLRDGLLEDLRGNDRHVHTTTETENTSDMDEISRTLQEDVKLKKQWVGKKGRLVVDGIITAEGIIEFVSECGVFVSGVRGYLRELQLAPEN